MRLSVLLPLLLSFLLSTEASVSALTAPQHAPSHPDDSYTTPIPALPSPGTPQESFEEADSGVFTGLSLPLQQLEDFSARGFVLFIKKLVEERLNLTDLEEGFRVMEDTNRYLEDAKLKKGSSHSNTNDTSTIDTTVHGLAERRTTISRRRRSDIYPLYIARNIITFVQISMVLTRMVIVAGQYFYNKINIY